MDEAQQRLQSGLKEAGARRGEQRFVLRLYVAGSTPRSMRAIGNIQRICDRYLAGRFDLEVIDIYQQADLGSASEHFIAAPTLVKMLPLPLRHLVGDLSNEPLVLSMLGISSDDKPLPASVGA